MSGSVVSPLPPRRGAVATHCGVASGRRRCQSHLASPCRASARGSALGQGWPPHRGQHPGRGQEQEAERGWVGLLLTWPCVRWASPEAGSQSYLSGRWFLPCSNVLAEREALECILRRSPCWVVVGVGVVQLLVREAHADSRAVKRPFCSRRDAGDPRTRVCASCVYKHEEGAGEGPGERGRVTWGIRVVWVKRFWTSLHPSCKFSVRPRWV